MREKIYSIVSRIFEVSVEEINENSSTETVERWDSLSHINLILALEEEFVIEFSVDQITELTNVQSIIDAVNCLTK